MPKRSTKNGEGKEKICWREVKKRVKGSKKKVWREVKKWWKKVKNLGREVKKMVKGSKKRWRKVNRMLEGSKKKAEGKVTPHGHRKNVHHTGCFLNEYKYLVSLSK